MRTISLLGDAAFLCANMTTTSSDERAISHIQGATGTPPVELHFGRALPALAQQFCVVAPQTSAGWPAERVRAFMRFLLGAESPLPCRIDQSRCYVTGHSMGGSGALVSWA